MNSERIRWGILGAGDVCEVKSGPAFRLAEGSELTAVMRRDGARARDFARRHQVGRWYDSVANLLADDTVNAIYVATPPRFHLEHTLAALNAGKHVYLEKPMAMTVDECRQIMAAEQAGPGRVAVAHYRRALPAFTLIGQLLAQGTIGTPRIAEVNILLPKDSPMIAASAQNWRLDPAISGGGLFHDLAPHLLDLMLVYFGQPLRCEGFALRQQQGAGVDDLVQGSMLFSGSLLFRGCWCFTVAAVAARDELVIIGDQGELRCDFFGSRLLLRTAEGEKSHAFTNPPNIQQPMIQQVVDYFRGIGPCPCTTADGCAVVEIMDRFTRA